MKNVRTLIMPVTVSDGCYPHGSIPIRNVLTSDFKDLDSCEWHPSDWNRHVSEGCQLHEFNSLNQRYLAQGCNFNVLAWTFKTGVSTVKQVIYETCDAIWNELHDIYLSTPNRSEQVLIAENFFVKTGMPNCLGAIDGKHINIVRPSNSGSLYYNYKKTYSIVLLAACDANYVFTYVDVGALGSQSDGGVLAQSAFGKKLLNGTLEVPRQVNLPGTSCSFPYYFVGDSAFPLKANLMRPFPEMK